MVADNNLDEYAVQDINEMESTWDDSFGQLIVYLDRADGAAPAHPILLKIIHDTTKSIRSRIIQTYPEQNSCDPTIITTVLKNIVDEFEAQSYGLIYWSHGSAWLPHGNSIGGIRTTGKINTLPIKSFGIDHNEGTEIADLAKSLPCHFNFILFDACYMASVEVLAEFSTYADYIIASPTEILATGFPYHKTIPALFEHAPNFKTVCTDFMTDYKNRDGIYKSASITLFDLQHWTNFITHVKSIFATIGSKKINTLNIQQYEIAQQNYLFDIKDLLVRLDTVNIHLHDNQLSKLIPFNDYTNEIEQSLALTSVSGLSMFLPDSSNTNYHEYYKNLKWYKQSNYNFYFSL